MLKYGRVQYLRQKYGIVQAQLTTLIKKSEGGNSLSSDEINKLGVNTLKGLLKSKNINTTGVTKKAEFINLLK